jgi:hypothetical protein
MKMKKLFHGRIEVLPVIGQFVVESYSRDVADFSAYSPVFTVGLVAEIEKQIELCRNATRSWIFIKELKTVSVALYATIGSVRVKMNALEGYVHLAGSTLDLTYADFGIVEVRRAVSRKNAETVPEAIRQLLINVKRNFTALQAVGMQQTLYAEIEKLAMEIDRLNARQNVVESERNLQTEADLHLFNDLWLAIAPIFETGKALYRGVDEARLKDYTFAQLEKRLHPHRKHTGEENEGNEEN